MFNLVAFKVPMDVGGRTGDSQLMERLLVPTPFVGLSITIGTNPCARF